MSKFATDMASHPIFNNDETIPINTLGYTIGQVAKMLHLNISQLRYYDNQGLLPFLKRNEKGDRVFDDEALKFLEIILCLKNTGMPIKKIGQWTEMIPSLNE